MESRPLRGGRLRRGWSYVVAVLITMPAPRGEVFRHLADIENLPDWATEFARELKHVDGHHKVVNNPGELFFELHAHPDNGIIDMYAGPAPTSSHCSQPASWNSRRAQAPTRSLNVAHCVRAS
jgi:hypothetical protein